MGARLKDGSAAGALLAPEPGAGAVSRSERSSHSTAGRPSVAILGSRGIPARYGGFETFVEELSVRLVERGIDVTVFCEAAAGSPARSEWKGVRLEHVRAWAPGPARTLQFDLSCLWRARSDFDLVYMLGYGSSVFCPLPRLFGSRVWINMDGLEWRRSKWSGLARAWLRSMESLAFRAADRLILDNGALGDVYRSRGRRARAESVIEYGARVVDEDLPAAPLERFGVTRGGYYLVVCRFEPENHVREIVSAFQRARTSRKLVVVANNDVGTDYAAELLRCDDPRVSFPGAVYDPEVLLPLRRHAHAYVHGHSVGGTNPSLLEAMGCANLVLAHDNPFNRETLQDGGLFFGGEDDLVQRFEECERMHDAERLRLGAAGRERVRSHYSWDRIADRYAELIRAQVGA